MAGGQRYYEDGPGLRQERRDQARTPPTGPKPDPARPGGRGTGPFSDYDTTAPPDPLSPGEGSSQWRRTRRGMSPIYQNTGPANQGLPWLEWAIKNWQVVPGSNERLAGNLQSNEMKWNQASNVARQTSYGTGGQQSGAQRATRSQVPVERAKGTVGTLVEQEEWKTKMQEDRLASLLWPYVQQYNNVVASAYGLPPVSFGNNLQDYLRAANEILNNLNQAGLIPRRGSSRPNTGQSDQDTGQDYGQTGTRWP